MTHGRDIREYWLHYHVMVTFPCDLLLDSLSHVDDASLVKITVGANAKVHTNC